MTDEMDNSNLKIDAESNEQWYNYALDLAYRVGLKRGFWTGFGFAGVVAGVIWGIRTWMGW